MEKILPHDELDGFLKKSFEGYTESPSDDLWDKIDAELGSAPSSPPPARSGWWWAAAVVVVLTGMIVFQQVYFNQRIAELSDKIESKSETKIDKRTESDTPSNTSEELQNRLIEESGSDVPQAQADYHRRITKSNTAGRINEVSATAKTRAVIPKSKSRKTSSEPVAATINPESGKPPLPVRYVQESTDALLSPTDESAAITETPTTTLKQRWQLDYLPSRSCRASAQQTSVPQLVLNPILSAALSGASPMRLSAGVRTMPMMTFVKINSINPPHHMGPSVVNDETLADGSTLFNGLALGLALKNNFSLYTGIDYRNTNITSTHKPNFKFSDRVGMPMGHAPHEYNFKYNLSTSVGVVAVELRVAQADSTRQIPENEDIPLEIKTSQSLEYISIPLGLSYRFGKGRLGFNLKGGLIANILLKNDFEISKITSFSPNFMQMRNGNSVGALNGLNKVTIDFSSSIGFDYAFLNSWSFSLEPTFIRSLTKQSQDLNINSSSYSIGLNGSLLYHF